LKINLKKKKNCFDTCCCHSSGFPGPRGITGEPSPFGAKGDKGNAGDFGFAGEKGILGDSGEKGPRGEPGVSGRKGRLWNMNMVKVIALAKSKQQSNIHYDDHQYKSK